MDTARSMLVPEAAAPVPDAEILQILQRSGPMAAEALAAAASMSRSAVLRRLATFGAAGLVERPVLRRDVGRPRFPYDVTA